MKLNYTVVRVFISLDNGHTDIVEELIDAYKIRIKEHNKKMKK